MTIEDRQPTPYDEDVETAYALNLSNTMLAKFMGMQEGYRRGVADERARAAKVVEAIKAHLRNVWLSDDASDEEVILFNNTRHAVEAALAEHQGKE